MNRPGLVQPVGCRSVMSTGVGIALVADGAILRFAIPAAFTHGLNLRVVGVIVMLAGVIALLLSLLVWGPLSRPRGDIGQGPRGQGHGHSSLTNPPYATLGLVTIALVVPACTRGCDSGCSGPWRHLTT